MAVGFKTYGHEDQFWNLRPMPIVNDYITKKSRWLAEVKAVGREYGSFRDGMQRTLMRDPMAMGILIHLHLHLILIATSVGLVCGPAAAALPSSCTLRCHAADSGQMLGRCGTTVQDRRTVGR